MVILQCLNDGITGISVFPFCSCSLFFSVHMHNKHVVYTLEDYNDELFITLQVSQHISPIYSAIFHACFSIIIGWGNSTDVCISGRTC